MLARYSVAHTLSIYFIYSQVYTMSGVTLSTLSFGEAIVKRKRTIVYWGFAIDIVGPQYKNKADRKKARKVLSRKALRGIEQAAWLATRAKLPPGFRAVLS
jgi:hypothetical protein